MLVSRRVLRAALYVAALIVVLVLVLLRANKTRLIHLDELLPAGWLPLYFQPLADAYVVDIAVGDCNLFNKGLSTCGMPRASDGLYGDVGEEGGWLRIDKDLLLNSHWTAKRFISIKRISPEYYEAHRSEVILDVTVGNPALDCAIKGNKKCIPKSIISELNMDHLFDDKDLEALKESNRNERPNLYTDKSKTSAKYAADYEAKKAEEKKVEAVKSASTKTEMPGKFVQNAKDSLAPDLKGSKSVGQKRQDQDHLSLHRRVVETSHTKLTNYMRIPSDEEIKQSGWKQKAGNIWVKLGEASDKAVTGIDVLFGEDAKDPRPNWTLSDQPFPKSGLSADTKPRLSIRKGPKVNYKSSEYQPQLKFSAVGKLKILQVADLHFSTGVGKCRDPVPVSSAKNCQADPRTLKFIEKVLDLEKPDFVVMTGDQVFGDEAPDPETALFKAVNPFVKRKIPFAITLGNHDDESVLSREEMMRLASSLPFSLSAVGPETIDGFGNYPVTVLNSRGKAAAVFYFLDSHSRSKLPKTNPGYDWFKESQIDWLEMQAMAIKDTSQNDKLLSMAFFHIPITEYRNLEQPMVGSHKEGITASRYVTQMRNAFEIAGVQVTSCGHDHANDFCLFDTQGREDNKQSLIWLCYGGGAGEGGYGGYGGYIRRVRVFELDSGKHTIKSWKRAENDPDTTFDMQTLVENAKAVNLQ